MKTELFVELKVADPTATTTRRTLKRLGVPIVDVRRLEHYTFDAQGPLFGAVSTCDVLVNANKHTSYHALEREQGCVYVLVTDLDGHEGLRATLNKRFGLGINHMSKGVLWELRFDAPAAQLQSLGNHVAKLLLCNEHYQEFVIL